MTVTNVPAYISVLLGGNLLALSLRDSIFSVELYIRLLLRPKSINEIVPHGVHLVLDFLADLCVGVCSEGGHVHVELVAQ